MDIFQTELNFDLCWPLPWPTDLLFCFLSYRLQIWTTCTFLQTELKFDLCHDLLTYFFVFELQASNLDHMYIFANWIEIWPLQWPTDLLLFFLTTGFKFGPHVHFCNLNRTLTFIELYFDLLTSFLFFELQPSNLDHMYNFAYLIKLWHLLAFTMTYWPNFCFWRYTYETTFPTGLNLGLLGYEN